MENKLSIWQMFKTKAAHRKFNIPQSIRGAIDTLPGGLCFSTRDGRLILTNRRMNELIYRLTDHTVMNAQATWDELQQFSPMNGCEKLEELQIKQEALDKSGDEHMLFLFPNGSIWRFRRKTLMEQHPHYIQLEATDITDLYQYSKELALNNKRLAEQYKRQRNLLAHIVEINREKELLLMKMRIHDDLGRSILTTKQHLSNQSLDDNTHSLVEMWNKTIQGLTDSTSKHSDGEISPEIELQRAADMIGCRINFYGDRPSHRKTELLFYAVVREALTNAVRHANADRLNVVIELTGRWYRVEISDNGNIPISSLTQGSGLSHLRRRLEQEGATLEVKYENGVVLIASLPIEKEVN